MNWPTSQDYNEAIQNSSSSFSDPVLKSGEVAVNAIGLPVPRSGNFADVYQFKGGDGKTWALKCFTRKVAGLQERYAKIDEHIGKANFPFTVGFNYLAEGIRIRGQWFPVLKMEWVEGFTLNEFVRNNAGKPQYLHALMQMWAKLCARLRDGNFAHADLQHGNVLLVPGEGQNKLGLKLIDYDGMWVPSLADYHSGEIGHPNFQHPLRLRDKLYNGDVDRFPHLVIACALRATVLGGRALWDKFDNGDNLLFKEACLRDPGNAKVFKTLWDLNDDVLCVLLGKMALASKEPMRKTPWLDDVLLTEEGERLTDAEEKKVMELLGVGAHFTASKAAAAPAALAAPAASEFGDFEVLDDEEDKKAAVRREGPKKKKPKREEKKEKAKSFLPYYIGGGVAAVALIVAIVVAMSGGGNKGKPAPAEVAANNVPQQGQKSGVSTVKNDHPGDPKKPAKKDTTVEPKVAERPPVKVPTDPVKQDIGPPTAKTDWAKVDLTKADATTLPDGFVRLSPGLPMMVTREWYTGDVEIVAVARTDGLNIRLYAGRGAMVIFNWEKDPNQLRVHRPDGRSERLGSGSIATANLKSLAPNTWYTLRWLFTEKGLSVFVNGERVFEDKATYDLTAKYRVRVGCNGSTVDVKSLEVSPSARKDGPAVAGALAAPRLLWKTDDGANSKCLVFSDDGTQLLRAPAREPKTIHVHNAADGKRSGEAIAFEPGVRTMRPGPNNLLAVTTDDGKLAVFDYKTNKTHFAVGVANKDVLCAVAHDANFVVVDDAGGGIGVYSLADGKKIDAYKPPQAATIASMACTPDGKTIAALAQEGALFVKNPDAPNFRPIHNAGGQGNRRLALSADGAFAAFGIGKAPIIVIDVATRRLHRVLGGLGAEIEDLAFTKDGRHLVAAGLDKKFCLWDIDNNIPIHSVSLDDPARALALSLDGQFLALATDAASSLQFWRLTAKGGPAVAKKGPDNMTKGLAGDGPVSEIKLVWSNKGAAMRECLAFSNDGRQIIACPGSPVVLRLYDVKDGELLKTVPVGSRTVQSFAVCPDDLLVTCDNTQKAVVWNLKTGAMLFPLDYSPNGLAAISVAAETRKVWMGHRTQNGQIGMANLTDGKVSGSYQTKADDVFRQLACSANGRFNVAITSKGDVFTKTPESKGFQMVGNIAGVSRAWLAPDGKSFLVAGPKTLLRLYDMNTGNEQRSFGGQTSIVLAAAFSRNGKYVLAIAGDLTLRLWNVETGKALQTIKLDGTALSLAISPDGKYAATSTGNPKSIQLWRLPDDLAP